MSLRILVAGVATALCLVLATPAPNAATSALEDGFYLVIDDPAAATANTVVVETRDTKETLTIERTLLVSAREIKSASVSEDRNLRQPVIAIELTDAGGAAMKAATSKYVGRKLALVLDGKVVSAPLVRDPIGSEVQIFGNFTADDAKALAARLSPQGSR